ncbi:MAG: SLBB domain-containing protein [Caulobacteraceae bacterium]
MPILTAALLLIAAPAYAQPAAPAQAQPSAAAKAPESPAMAVAVDANFLLGLGDSVSVTLVGGRDFDTRTQVSSEGTVVLPLVGKVKAVGLTTDQLEQAVETVLKKGGFYANPVVHVDVTGVASRYVTVLGEVGNPGLMPLDRSYHLSDIVARVGARAGEGTGTVVLTRANGESKKYTIEELATGSGAGDPLIEPGDKIYVPPTAAEVIFISGQVKAPGTFPLTKNMTIRDAIARGGGLTEMGSERKLKLFRKNVQVNDLKLDTPLQAGDILQIGERLF